jgi:hypothetical protein
MLFIKGVLALTSSSSCLLPHQWSRLRLVLQDGSRAVGADDEAVERRDDGARPLGRARAGLRRQPPSCGQPVIVRVRWLHCSVRVHDDDGRQREFFF